MCYSLDLAFEFECWNTELKPGLTLQGVVGALASLTIESTSNVNPAVAQLQMLAALAEAWALRWPNRPLLLSPVASPIGLTGSSDWQPVIPSDGAFDQAECIWRCREEAAGAGLGFSGMDDGATQVRWSLSNLQFAFRRQKIHASPCKRFANGL